GLVEEAHRRLDALELEAADAEAEEHVRAFDVGEAWLLRQRPGAVQELNRPANLARPRQRLRLAGEQTNLELGQARGEHGRAVVLELRDRLALAVPLRQRLG